MDRESFTNNRLVDDVRADRNATATELLLAERLAEAAEELERMEHSARERDAQLHVDNLPAALGVG